MSLITSHLLLDSRAVKKLEKKIIVDRLNFLVFFLYLINAIIKSSFAAMIIYFLLKILNGNYLIYNTEALL